MGVACALSLLATGCPQLLEDEFMLIGDLGDTPRRATGTAEGGSPDPGVTIPTPPASQGGGANGSIPSTSSAGESAGSSDTGGNGTATPSGGTANAGTSGTSIGGNSNGGAGGTGGVAPGPEGGLQLAGAGGMAEVCVPQDEYCDGRDNDCNGDVDDGVCDGDCVGYSFGEHGYVACNTVLSAADALTACEEHGMYLVEIQSPEENAAVTAHAPTIDVWTSSTYFGPTAGAWIGAVASEDMDEWHWDVSGDVFWRGDASVAGVYANWGEGQPNNTTGDQTCAGLYVEDGSNGNAGEWNDADCGAELAYVCEAD